MSSSSDEETALLVIDGLSKAHDGLEKAMLPEISRRGDARTASLAALRFLLSRPNTSMHTISRILELCDPGDRAAVANIALSATFWTTSADDRSALANAARLYKCIESLQLPSPQVAKASVELRKLAQERVHGLLNDKKVRFCTLVEPSSLAYAKYSVWLISWATSSRSYPRSLSRR